MTAIAVNNSCVARGHFAETEKYPERQKESNVNTVYWGHFKLPKLESHYASIIRVESGITFRGSLRQSIEHIHRLNRLTRFTETSEPTIIDFYDPTRAVESGESAINCQTKCSIVPPHHKPIGLIGK